MAQAWNRKVSDDQILASYKRLNSIWKVAKEVGLCGQSVHERLVKLNANVPQRNFTEQEREIIKEVYSSGIKRGDGKLDALCIKLNREMSTIVGQAKHLGLTSQKRKMCEGLREKHGERSKKWHSSHDHPRGMLGKTHSPENCEAQSKRMVIRLKNLTPAQKRMIIEKSFRTKVERYGTVSPRIPPKVTWKQGWRLIGGKKIYARSRWEANYARYLQWKKEKGEIKEWEHEPKTFWFDMIKRGSVSYLPDFRVTNLDGSHFWVEVKGYMDARSKTKINRFKRYFKEEKLEIKDGEWFAKNNRRMGYFIKDWEKEKDKLVELIDAIEERKGEQGGECEHINTSP